MIADTATRRVVSGFKVGTVVAILSLLTGCGASRPVSQIDNGYAGSDVVTFVRDGVTFSVLPYTGAMEEHVFDVNLHRANIAAFELKVEMDSTTAGAGSVTFHRSDIQLALGDGSRRYPIDEGKVYEKSRINPAGATLMFGLVGAAIAIDEEFDRRDTLFRSSFQEVTLDAETPSVAAILFFDLEGTDASPGSSLIIAYEDSAAPDDREVEIALDGWHFTPELGPRRYGPGARARRTNGSH